MGPVLRNWRPQMVWFIYLAVALLITNYFRTRDREAYKTCAFLTGLFVVGSFALGALNYVQLGRVFL